MTIFTFVVLSTSVIVIGTFFTKFPAAFKRFLSARKSISDSPRPTLLIDKLLKHLASGSPAQREHAERLLGNYPGPELVEALLPFLDGDPWDDGAAAAARLLLLHGDEKVIEPLNRFYSRLDGGFAAYLDQLDAQREAARNVVSIHGAVCSSASFLRASKASVYRLKRS